MRVLDFDFDLPRRFIAQRPAAPRDSARLLAVGRQFRDLGIADLPGLLNPGDIMVINDTRVIPARLIGRRQPSGGKIEVTLIKPGGENAWQTLANELRLPAFAKTKKAGYLDPHAIRNTNVVVAVEYIPWARLGPNISWGHHCHREIEGAGTLTRELAASGV